MTFAQVLQHGQHTLEQTDVVLMRHIVMAITLAEQRVFLFRHVGGRAGQGRYQGHADHIGGGLVAGHLPTNIGNGVLNAAHDDAGGIEQGAVPIEGDQIETARACAHA